MTEKEIANKVFGYIEPKIAELGYELVEVEYCHRHGAMQLTVFVYSDTGVGLDDCEKVHYAIDPLLDELDPTAGAPYNLNVSSSGLDRAIVTDRDYKRNIGKELEIKLFAAIDLDKKKLYVGRLESFDDKVAVFRENRTGNVLTFERAKIAKLVQYIKF